MRNHHFVVFLLAALTLTLAAQNTPSTTTSSPPGPQRVVGPPGSGATGGRFGGPNVPQPAAPANMGSLAIHFTGTVNTNVKLDVTVTAQGASPSNSLLDVRVVSVTQRDSGYLVNYVANGQAPSSRGNRNVSSGGASGWVFLKPGQPVTTVKSANTDVTLTLTELAP